MQQSPHNQTSGWRATLATIKGSHVIPDGIVKCVKVSVKDALVLSDVCIDNASHVNSLAEESTLSCKEENILLRSLLQTLQEPQSP